MALELQGCTAIYEIQSSQKQLPENEARALYDN